MACLTNLPEELISHILSFLAAGEPPSKRYLHEEPCISSLVSANSPLKNLVQSCQLLHRLSWVHLFSHLRTNVGSASGLVTLVDKYGLRGSIQGLVLYSINPRAKDLELNHPSCEGKPKLVSVGKDSAATWSQALSTIDSINPLSVTIILPPAEFENILPYKLNLELDWAFDIPYQTLHLEQTHDIAQTEVPATATQDHDIFSLRRWSHMTFNEGSSIPAYSTYEHFQKYPPSLLCPKNLQDTTLPSEAFSQLTSFHYIAVFPIKIKLHTNNLIMCMEHLRSLHIRFSPSPTNDVLDNPTVLGRCQSSDLWMALAQNYCYFINQLEWRLEDYLGDLSEFLILDYWHYGIHELLEAYGVQLEHEGGDLEGTQGWRFKGEGRWIREH